MNFDELKTVILFQVSKAKDYRELAVVLTKIVTYTNKYIKKGGIIK